MEIRYINAFIIIIMKNIFKVLLKKIMFLEFYKKSELKLNLNWLQPWNVKQYQNEKWGVVTVLEKKTTENNRQ